MNYSVESRTITTERLVLRQFQQSDAEAVARLCNNYNIYKNTLYLPYPYTLEDASTWITRHSKNISEDKAYEFAITDKVSGELFGAIALSHNQKFKQGEIAYWVGEEYWGNGYATEAAQAIVQFAFKEKNLHKVFARFFSSNPASGRVLEKLGMKQEGILIDHVIKDDHYESLIYYGIINGIEDKGGGQFMTEKLVRVGTTYIPVSNVGLSSEWYVNKLGAELNYLDEDKAIINLANQSFFLVKARDNQSANFIDYNGVERFSMTFEVAGLKTLEALHKEFKGSGIQVGEIEDRGHAGRNFVFFDLDGNTFDVWSELSPSFRKNI